MVCSFKTTDLPLLLGRFQLAVAFRVDLLVSGEVPNPKRKIAPSPERSQAALEFAELYL